MSEKAPKSPLFTPGPEEAPKDPTKNNPNIPDWMKEEPPTEQPKVPDWIANPVVEEKVEPQTPKDIRWMDKDNIDALNVPEVKPAPTKPENPNDSGVSPTPDWIKDDAA